VHDRDPDWHLLILGEGVQRAELEKMVEYLHLEGSVHMPGAVKNPYDYYRTSDLFVLSSRYEGQPNALCEAMICSLPVIAANCSPGVSDIVEDGVNGVLVPPEDVDGLSAVLDNLMADPQRRAQISLHASKIATRFGVEHVMQLWEQLMTS
jgi:GalNAc-alpha-(1->4)-GalNAc-alpha-(1->3)-diNAcBac-PP-undecaprenol alpha-1,4-N-acetyl-D-galactosaminyltransferase